MSGLADIAREVGLSNNKSRTPADIVTFVEADWGLKMRLYPVQRVILKAHYGIPLDEKKKNVEITDWRRQNLKIYTEADYLRMLFDEGRSNIREVIPGQQRRKMVLPIGRRSGKTALAAIISGYETYVLILKGNPQSYYGLPATKDIQIMAVATDKDQAGLLYSDVSGFFRECNFFAPYTANNTLTYARFQTPYDINRFGSYAEDNSAKASLRVSFRSCVAKGLRGPGYIVIILDELAHFVDGGQSSAEAVYQAVSPAVATFTPKDPTDPRVPMDPRDPTIDKNNVETDGRIIAISSPLGRQGLFYKLFEMGFRGGRAAADMLCIQAPTWEVNPTIPAGYFEGEYAKDPVAFFTEFGAEFTDRTRGWIEDERDLVACIDTTRRPRQSARARQPHFMGVDVGLVIDPSAVAIGHLEPGNDGITRVVLDHIDQIQAGEGKYADKERLEFDDVVQWVYDLSRRFYISEGMFDQWAGIPFEQALMKRGMKQVKADHMTKNKLSEIFKTFKDMMYDGRLILFDDPILDGEKHCTYIQQLLELQAETHSKYIVTVEAPNIAGKHDDLADALVRMVWIACKNLGKASHFAKGNQGGGTGSWRQVQAEARMRHKQLNRTGSHPSRQIPKKNSRNPRGLAAIRKLR